MDKFAYDWGQFQVLSGCRDRWGWIVKRNRGIIWVEERESVEGNRYKSEGDVFM